METLRGVKRQVATVDRVLSEPFTVVPESEYAIATEMVNSFHPKEKRAGKHSENWENSFHCECMHCQLPPPGNC